MSNLTVTEFLNKSIKIGISSIGGTGVATAVTVRDKFTDSVVIGFAKQSVVAAESLNNWQDKISLNDLNLSDSMSLSDAALVAVQSYLNVSDNLNLWDNAITKRQAIILQPFESNSQNFRDSINAYKR